MVVMEEAACFGSQAEVPGTGGGAGEQGRSGEKPPLSASVTGKQERAGAGRELLGLGLAFCCCRRQHPQTLRSAGSAGCSSPPGAKQPAPPSPRSPPHTCTLFTLVFAGPGGAATGK